MERDVINEVTRLLRVPRHRRGTISRELQSHLEAAQRDLELAGWRREDAAREVVARLGDPCEIVEGFTEVYRPARRKRVGLAFVLATGLLLGAYGASGTLASARSTHRAPVTRLHNTAVARSQHDRAGVGR